MENHGGFVLSFLQIYESYHKSAALFGAINKKKYLLPKLWVAYESYILISQSIFIAVSLPFSFTSALTNNDIV